MTKIISFSLWGSHPRYTQGAIKNALLAKEIFQDWLCYFYIGGGVPFTILEQLQEFDNVRVIKVSSQFHNSGLFWRFQPFFDSNIDVAISRDTDSRLSWREKYAVDEWLSSGKTFHIIRDHPYHRWPIMGGLWGCCNPQILQQVNLQEVLEYFQDYNDDQRWLKEKVYPLTRGNACIHDEIFSLGRPFPTKRSSDEYVGATYDENDLKPKAHTDALMKALENPLLTRVKSILTRIKNRW